MLKFEASIRELAEQVLGLDSVRDMDEKDDFERHGMDSINCMRFVIALEEAFGIEFPDDRLGLRFVRTIRDVNSLLEELTAKT